MIPMSGGQTARMWKGRPLPTHHSPMTSGLGPWPPDSSKALSVQLAAEGTE